MTDSLISRLQSATCPSRDLDAKIALANGWRNTRLLPGALKPCWHDDKGRIAAELPHYTSSIDDALTLLPEGRYWKVGIDASGIGYSSVFGSKRIYEGATPAIALVIAILRAKEETKP